MSKGTIITEKERRLLRSLLREIPVEDLSTVLSYDLFQLHGTGRAETILLDAARKVNRGEV